MGCGQSRIGGMVYPRKGWKSKTDKRKVTKSEKTHVSCELDHDQLSTDSGGEEEPSRRNGAASANLDDAGHATSNAVKSYRSMAISGPILAQVELSASQMEFFRMLDEKIDLGKDYDSQDDETLEDEAFQCPELDPMLPRPPLHVQNEEKTTNAANSAGQSNSWPNGDLLTYDGKTKSDGRGSRSWFSDTYSAWPLRRFGAGLHNGRKSTAT